MGSAWSSCVYTHPYIVHLRHAFDIKFVGGANVVCFVSLLTHRAIHSTLWISQTSDDHEQGSMWPVTGACYMWTCEVMRALKAPVVR